MAGGRHPGLGMSEPEIRGPFLAKFDGWCLSCGAEVVAGKHKVYWCAGVGTWHHDCDRPRSLAMYASEAEVRKSFRRSVFE